MFTMRNNNKDRIKPITLNIDKDRWEVFKNLVPRDEKLNDVICGLIYQYITDYSEPADMNSKEFKDWLKRIHKHREVKNGIQRPIKKT
jgi:hypothetical protein